MRMILRQAFHRKLLVRDCRYFAIAALGMFVFCVLSVELTRQGGPVSSIWAATAFNMAFLLRSPKRRWLGLLIAGFGASFGARYLHGDEFLKSLVLSTINTLEAFALAYFLRRDLGRYIDLENFRHMEKFALASISFAIPSALLASSFVALNQHVGFKDVVITWYTADALGLIVFAPLFYVIGWSEIKEWADPVLRRKVVLSFAVLIVVLAGTFLQTAYPLLFLIFPVMTMIAFWIGTPGVVVALALTTGVSIFSTITGTGPINIMQGSLHEKTLILQTFLSAAVVISMPTAAALSTRQRLQDSLRHATLAAEKANRAKSEFLTAMSHELRTPLNAISGFAQLLHANRKGNLTEEDLEYLGYVIDGGDYLLKLINDVLDLAKIEAGKVAVEISSLATGRIVSDAAALLEPLARKRNIDIAIRIPDAVTVHADAGRLTQVVVNLLSNAIKYNRENGRVDVGFERRGGMARITVKDTGPGIPASRHAEVFQPFNRLGAERSSVEGTGIGLAICCQLIRAMNGDMGFTSREGEGSVFWIDLPLSNFHGDVLEGDHAIVAGSAELAARILYIEDNPANISLMRSVIAHFTRAQLDVAATGQDGVAQARTGRPDIIITDIHLPDITGYEVLAQLRNDPALSAIPVIALTADATQSGQGRENAFDVFMHKPYKISELFQAIGTALDTTRASAGG